VLNQYAIYVLHLEKALQQVESAVLAAEAGSKKSDKGVVPEEVRLGRYLLVSCDCKKKPPSKLVAYTCFWRCARTLKSSLRIGARAA
jgi:hypothetical protein